MIPGFSKTFSGILADPPWPYDSPRALVGNGGRGSDDGKAALIIQADVEQHYPTMTLDQIKSLPVPTRENCLLFMWTTNPFLADGSAADVVRAWGFIPKTVLTWAKVKADGKTPSMKTGHWFRSASEHVIFAVRGKVRRPENWPAFPTWKPAPRLPHSVKPSVFHSWLEQACPEGPWLELFARRARPGWSSWGNEIPQDADLKHGVENEHNRNP